MLEMMEDLEENLPSLVLEAVATTGTAERLTWEAREKNVMWNGVKIAYINNVVVLSKVVIVGSNRTSLLVH